MNNLEDDIEVVEAGYEFLLAYAAQGRPPHEESTMPTPHAGPTLENMLQAMSNVAKALSEARDKHDKKDEFEQLMIEDIRKASAAIKFVLAQPRMSSELIDNLNASIHLRAVLTNFFLYGEVFRPVDVSE